MFRAKGALVPRGIETKPLPPQNRRKRGGPASIDDPWRTQPVGNTLMSLSPQSEAIPQQPSIQLSAADALAKLSIMEALAPPSQPDSYQNTVDSDGTERQTEALYCPECYLPLHPDPKPEKLYIFLHALKYTTSLGSFETEMPEWAKEGFEWDQ